MPCVHDFLGIDSRSRHFFIVTAMVIVLTMVLLVLGSWSLIACSVLAPGTLCAGNFLLLLDSLLLLLAMVAAWGAASLRRC